MHPHNLVFNPPTLERLVEQIDATHVGAEMDPSHLFWQGIDPVAAVEHLGDLVYHAAAKDTRINAAAQGQRRARRPVRPRRPRRPGAARPRRPQHPEPLAGAARRGSSWPSAAATTSSSGRAFLRALAAIDPDMAVNIEHEDQELDQVEGLRFAAETLRAAASRLGGGDHGQVRWGVLSTAASAGW